MKKLIPGFVAVAVALSLSAFTMLKPNSKTLDEYFGNLGTRATPNWVYIGNTNPGTSDCITNPANDCIGKSAAGHDVNGHPLGTVTVLTKGTFQP